MLSVEIPVKKHAQAWKKTVSSMKKSQGRFVEQLIPLFLPSAFTLLSYTTGNHL